MINLTRSIKITVTELVTQFGWKASRHYNSDFYATTVRLKEMYLIKYTKAKYQSALNPFKVMKL